MKWLEMLLEFIVGFVAPLIAVVLGMCGIGALFAGIIEVHSELSIGFIKDLKIHLAFIAVGVILIALSVLYFWALSY
jgi:hypothetical protein